MKTGTQLEAEYVSRRRTIEYLGLRIDGFYVTCKRHELARIAMPFHEVEKHIEAHAIEDLHKVASLAARSPLGARS
jgi:hypothetical protein